MVKLNDHQKRLISSGVENVNRYKNGEIQLDQLVSRLEGVIHAGEFKDAAFVDDFYRAWMPLEIIVSSGEENLDAALISREVDAIGDFLSHSQNC